MPDVLEVLKVLASFLIYYFFQVSENNPLIGMTLNVIVFQLNFLYINYQAV